MRNTKDKDVACAYSLGKNEFLDGSDAVLSLTKFSRNPVYSDMKDDHMHHLHVCVFLVFRGERFDGKCTSLHANTLVKDSFELKKVCRSNLHF